MSSDPKCIDPLCGSSAHSWITQGRCGWMPQDARQQAGEIAAAQAAHGWLLTGGVYDQLLERCIDDPARRRQE